MSKSSTSIIVHGATGRMGARVLALGASDPEVRIVAALEHAGSDAIGTPSAAPGVPVRSTAEAAKIADSKAVLLDFTSDEGALAAAGIARAARCALLVGTTALSARTLAALREASVEAAVLVAPNTSHAVAIVARLVADAARALGPGYECSIVEAHHSRKTDAPSGTALRLAVAVRGAGHTVRDDQVVSIRGGDVIGEHTVRFAGPGEYLEITHRATSRDLFALGALRAAKWLCGRAPGMYSIEETLGMPA